MCHVEKDICDLCVRISPLYSLSIGGMLESVLCTPPLEKGCAECLLNWPLQVQTASYTFDVAIAEDVLKW